MRFLFLSVQCLICYLFYHVSDFLRTDCECSINATYSWQVISPFTWPDATLSWAGERPETVCQRAAHPSLVYKLYELSQTVSTSMELYDRHNAVMSCINMESVTKSCGNMESVTMSCVDIDSVTKSCLNMDSFKLITQSWITILDEHTVI